jgi:hypothetical protein
LKGQLTKRCMHRHIWLTRRMYKHGEGTSYIPLPTLAVPFRVAKLS